jgi:oligopeptide transport system substrate-binding protein
MLGNPRRGRSGFASLVLLVSAIALGIAFAGCRAETGDEERNTATATPTATADVVPDAEQVLRVNLTSEPSTLDPQRATDHVSLTVVRNLCSGLLRLDEDDELQADLAEAIPSLEDGGISADGLTYTFRLREGLRWSDGTPLVAQSFVDAARRLFEPGSPNQYVDFYRVIASEGPDGDANLAYLAAKAAGETDLAELQELAVAGLRVEAPDDRTVVYHLNRPSPVFPLLASLWPLYPVRQDLVDQHGARWTEAGVMVCNGPFRLAEWRHGERLRLERNEHWHHDLPTLQSIEFDMVDEAALGFLAYQNNELDLVLLGPAELVQVRRDEALREQFRGYAQLVTIGVYPNASDPVLTDPRVRQALAGSLNRVEYASAVLEGNALPAYGWIPPGMPGHDPAVGRQYEQASAASRQLLADAGAEGITLSILTPQATVAVLTSEWLKEQWETNLGITVNIDVRETASFVAARGAGDFQLTVSGWSADYPDPQNWLPPFRTGAPLNAGRFSNADFDRLIDLAEVELDFDRRLDLFQQAQQVLIDEAGVIPLNHRIRGALVKPWVQGLVTSSREGTVPGDLFFERVVISGRP